MNTLKTIIANVVGAAVVLALAMGITLVVIHLTGTWDVLAKTGIAVHELLHPNEVYERAAKRGIQGN